MVTRKAMAQLGLGAVVALTGCSAGAGRVAVRPPESLAPRPAMAVAELVERNNRNAAAVQALAADAAVSGNFRSIAGGLDGPLVLERPRNFNLKLQAVGRDYVRIGSNEREFWFWTKDSEDRAVLVGEYGPGGSVPSNLLINPEWIVESLGLRTIPEEEGARLRLQKTQDPNVVLVEHHRDDGRGAAVLKQTYFDATTGKVRNHVYFGPDGRTRLAVVTPSDYQAIPVPSGEAGGSAAVEIPQRLHIELPATRKGDRRPELDIKLRHVEVNPALTETNREALFTIPQIAGYATRRINEPAAYAAEGPSRSYQSLPAPPVGAGTRLGEPEPIGADGTSFLWSDPLPQEADLASSPNDPVGEPAIVRPGFPESVTTSRTPPASADRRGSLGTGFYR